MCARMPRVTSNVANLIYWLKLNLSSRFDSCLELRNYEDQVYHPLDLKAAASLSLFTAHSSAK
jgi:hypothetical protein